MSGLRTYTQTDLRVPPTEANHIVRLSDMMEFVAGLQKQAVRAVLTDPFVGAYDNAQLTLTQGTPAVLIVDNITLAIDDRILLVGQTDLTQNGIYTVTTLGDDGGTATVLTRASDFNSSTDIINGLIVPVAEGEFNASTRWKLTAGTIPSALDTTNLIFTRDIVNLTKVVEMDFDIVGDDSTSAFAFTHNLDSRNVTHEIYDNATGETIIAQFTRTSGNDVRVDFGVPLEAGTELTLVIRAQVDPA